MTMQELKNAPSNPDTAAGQTIANVVHMGASGLCQHTYTHDRATSWQRRFRKMLKKRKNMSQMLADILGYQFGNRKPMLMSGTSVLPHAMFIHTSNESHGTLAIWAYIEVGHFARYLVTLALCSEVWTLQLLRMIVSRSTTKASCAAAFRRDASSSRQARRGGKKYKMPRFRTPL